jgi:hypothetical protein
MEQHVHPEDDFTEIQAAVKKGAEGDAITVCRRIVEQRTAEMHDGLIIDMQSANAVVQVHDALSKPENRARLAAMPVADACAAAWRAIASQSRR